jgi:hypothetical protein
MGAGISGIRRSRRDNGYSGTSGGREEYKKSLVTRELKAYIQSKRNKK